MVLERRGRLEKELEREREREGFSSALLCSVPLTALLGVSCSANQQGIYDLSVSVFVISINLLRI